MRIGELAKRSGLSASRIRFYEASGLLPSVERRANGYRDYGEQALWVLEIITGAQQAGFSLEEIRHLLPLRQDAWQHGELLAALQRKIKEIGGTASAVSSESVHVRRRRTSLGLPGEERRRFLRNTFDSL